MLYLVQIFLSEKATDLLGVHLLCHAWSQWHSREAPVWLCSPGYSQSFYSTRGLAASSVVSTETVNPFPRPLVNIFQRMQADGITCKAIVLVFQETQQHLESIQKVPTSRIKPELVYFTEIS